jgi:hypothetical protein
MEQLAGPLLTQVLCSRRVQAADLEQLRKLLSQDPERAPVVFNLMRKNVRKHQIGLVHHALCNIATEGTTCAELVRRLDSTPYVPP